MDARMVTPPVTTGWSHLTTAAQASATNAIGAPLGLRQNIGNFTNWGLDSAGPLAYV
jgi:hypothetical protein